MTTLRINVLRRNGVVAEIAAEVTAADAGVDAITVDERNAEASTLVIGVTVRSRSHLARLMRRLRNVAVVINLARSGH